MRSLGRPLADRPPQTDKGESEFPGAEKEGLLTIVKTFFAYAFVAPEFTMVPLSNGEPGMLDFRDFRMSGFGLLALGLWVLLLASGMVRAITDRRNRRLRCFSGWSSRLTWQCIFTCNSDSASISTPRTCR